MIANPSKIPSSFPRVEIPFFRPRFRKLAETNSIEGLQLNCSQAFARAHGQNRGGRTAAEVGARE